jgi:Holliday junction resolvasome RuvABC endonuclease subunit
MRELTSSMILGVAPGSRQIGVSVFKNQELIFYAVKTFRRKTEAESLANLRKIIGGLIETYEIKNVALEKITFIQQNRSFAKVASGEIKDFLEKRKVAKFEYHPKLIRQIICGLHKPTKYNAALLLSQKHIELARYFNVTRLWQKQYFAQLFEAVAVGFVCAIELWKIKLLSPKHKDKFSRSKLRDIIHERE